MLRSVAVAILMSALLAGCYRAPDRNPPAAPVNRPPPGCELEFDEDDQQWEIDCDDDDHDKQRYQGNAGYRGIVAKPVAKTKIITRTERAKQRAYFRASKPSRSKR